MSDPAVSDDIRSQRLILRRMDRAAIAACARGDVSDLEARLGVRVPPELGRHPRPFARDLALLAADPAFAPWASRAVILAAENRMVGHLRFHSPPGPAYLGALAPGGVELGYRIFSGDRRLGYGGESVAAAIGWARAAHGVARFVLSISPENLASLALARRLGFSRIAEVMDEEDGPEWVFEWRATQRRVSTLNPAARMRTGRAPPSLRG